MTNLYSENDWRREAQTFKPNSEQFRKESRRDLARLLHSASFRRLQGKTQLLPNADSDFFRNRLTHSIEVAQIAKSIAIRLNAEQSELSQTPIDLDLVEFAAFAHDLGHPPFGHIGEEALDECMAELGGFEGNAQTLRIISRLEKRDVRGGQPLGKSPIHPTVDGSDCRLGLNLTYRALASILKYDDCIPSCRAPTGTFKGYYYFDKDLISRIKQHVAPGVKSDFRLKTLECSIMDVADDIAYSTYDLEDTFKAGILSPLEILRLTQNEPLFDAVATKVNERLHKFRYREPGSVAFSRHDASRIVLEMFGDTFDLSEQLNELEALDPVIRASVIAAHSAQSSQMVAGNGYYRTHYTSLLVQSALNGVEFYHNSAHPMLSSVRLAEEQFCRVEVLKNLTFEVVIRSPQLKIIEFRGKKIVKDIFEGLATDEGKHLLPPDHRLIFDAVSDPAHKKRAICDFIAGMTDRYALEFYERLYGTSASTINQPL